MTLCVQTRKHTKKVNQRDTEKVKGEMQENKRTVIHKANTNVVTGGGNELSVERTVTSRELDTLTSVVITVCDIQPN